MSTIARQGWPGRLRGITFVVTLGALSLLPLIPVQAAPVVPNPVYRLEWVALASLVSRWLFPLVGASYHWAWYTYAAILLLILLSLAVSLLIRPRRSSA